MAKEKVTVAVVQETPQFFDNEATLEILENSLRLCQEEQTDLALFPESFLPGYPRGMDFGAMVGSRSDKGRKLFQAYRASRIAIGDSVFQTICDLARSYAIALAVGVTEKDPLHSTLYCTMLYISAEGNLIGKHRKIKPTGAERVIWGEGDGSTLQSHQLPWARMGGLICWENLMPEARLALYRSGLDIYLAPTADARPSWTASMQHIACEGRCFVLSANQYFRWSDYPEEYQPYLSDDLPESCCDGGSMIVSPYGQILAGPLFGKTGILWAQIDLKEIDRSRLDFDPVGHYTRPDLFDFRVRQK